MSAILPVDIGIADTDPVWVADRMNRLHRLLPDANVRDFETVLDAVDDLMPGHPAVLLCSAPAAAAQADVVRRLRAERPEVTVVVATETDAGELAEAGDPPDRGAADGSDVLAAVADAWTSRPGRDATPGPADDADPVHHALAAGLGERTMLIVVTAGKGGTGASTVAANLAAAFAARAGADAGPVVLVDAHGAWGDLPLLLGLPDGADEAAPDAAPATFDRAAIARRLVPHEPSGVRLLALGPEVPFGATGVRPLLEALVALDGTAAVVVVDAPLGLAVDAGLATFATAALLVTSGDIAALRDTALAATQLDRPDPLVAVLNHPAERPVAPDPDEVGRVVGLQVVAELPHDSHLAGSAHQRPPVVLPPERSGFAKRVRRLCDDLADQLSGRAPE